MALALRDVLAASADEAHVVADMANPVDRDDILMTDAREHLPFAQRIGAPCGVAHPNDLQRDFAREPGVPGARPPK